MKLLNQKLNFLKEHIDSQKSITIMIIGLGSVGNYLLNYLISLSDPKINIVVVGRNRASLEKDINIAKTAATIRAELRSPINIDVCDLDRINSIEKVISDNNPNFIVNTSRVFSGLKYGSISWHKLRAYGIWTPLAVRYIRNIMHAYQNVNSQAIVINTSYSDAVNPWLKSAGKAYPDFGSGNLTHLIPRIKFVIAAKFKIENLNDIDVTIATSHFHDVVISKEGHDENTEQLLSIKYRGEELDFDNNEVFKSCAISMPTDQKRNMMNASSNFEIINKILIAIRNNSSVKFHSPGIVGQIGGFPCIIDGTTKDGVRAYFDESTFSIPEMIEANMKSIELDGVERIIDGKFVYTDKLLSLINKEFKVELPKQVYFQDIDRVSNLIIEQIIKKNQTI